MYEPISTTAIPRILIAVADEADARTLTGHLDSVTCKIERAADGSAALAKAASFRPNLILLDPMLTNPSGFEIAKQLKANSWARETMILMIAELEQPADADRAIDAGIDDFISKPVDKTELLKRIPLLLKISAIAGKAE